MSQFPSAESRPSNGLTLKKAKGVYLYDTQGFKYSDFSLQRGEVAFGHAPPALTKYAKNALSGGLGTGGFDGRFTAKAVRLWEQKLQQEVRLYATVTEAFCALMSFRGIPSITAPSPWLQSLLKPFNFKEEEPSLILYEPAIETAPSGEAIALHPPSAGAGLAVHSRFFYRKPCPPAEINLLHGSPFGGRGCAILYGQNLPPQEPLPFMEAALLGEGAKFSAPSFPSCGHPLLENGNGFARLKAKITPEEARKHGVIIDEDWVFFSPLHSPQDIKRLEKALDLFR